MIGDKTEHFEGKGTDLKALQGHIEEYFKNDKFTVDTSAPSDQGMVIQAKKGGFLRGVVDADRALTISISGSLRGLHRFVSASAKWLEHLGVAGVETLFLSDLFLVVDVADSAWNLEIEDKLIKDIRTFVG